MSAKITRFSNGADGVFIKNDRFNTTLVSFNFYLPLARDTAARYALLPFMLTTCSKNYPDFSKLNFKLAKLYGANLSASAEKIGDFQLIKMGVSVIDDRYTLDGESLCDSALDLLCQLVFEPNVQNGAFTDQDTAREKRKAIEHIKGELAEKRIYSKNRLIEEMYKDDAYGIAKCGTIEDVEAITGDTLYDAWVKMLSEAYIRVNVISRNMPSKFFDKISEKLTAFERKNVVDFTQSKPTEKAAAVNTVTEKMDVAQGKLVMGFSSETCGTEEKTVALGVMCDIFGGGPYSRLFTNVREKMSLCYYCSASPEKNKGLITVSSGVEKENVEKAQAEILNQLEIIKHGEFSDNEFEFSIKSITDTLKSYNDSQDLIDLWYSAKIFKDTLLTPEETANLVGAVTRDDVIAVARGVNLHTVYKLLPQGV